MLRQLRERLEPSRKSGDVAAFSSALEQYARFQWRHMETEEREVPPLSFQHLDAEDWAVIDAAFTANREPRW